MLKFSTCDDLELFFYAADKLRLHAMMTDLRYLFIVNVSHFLSKISFKKKFFFNPAFWIFFFFVLFSSIF